MRLAILVRWAVFLAVLGWIGYSVVGAGLSYFAVQEILDGALRDGASRQRAVARGGQAGDIAGYIKSSIVLAAMRDGMAIQPSDVEISTGSGQISARLRWSHPVLSFGDREILVVPMSVRRSLMVAP
jgi:hypothetical protein